MRIETLLYVYLFICSGMIVFNIITAIVLKRRDRRTVRASARFRQHILQQIERELLARQSAFACDWTPLHNDAMYAILPADYPTDDRETFPITEFEGRDFLMPYGRFDIDVGAAFRKYGVKPVIRPCHVDDETVIRMVGKGLGISMMAEMMIRGKLNGVKTLPVSPSVSRELGMGLRPGGHLPEGIARLRECVLEFIGEL